MSTNTKDNESSALADLGKRYDFSPDAAKTALGALRRTGGHSAQFHHSEMGGSVQWMRGGMTQIGDMFNSALKDRVARLCADLAAHLNDFQDSPVADAKPEEDAKSEGESKRPSESDAPSEWGSPSSAGGQNGIHYAFYPSAHRLVVEENGKKTVYDTQDHKINGVSQQQGAQSSLKFSSNDGPVDVGSLRVVKDGLA